MRIGYVAIWRRIQDHAFYKEKRVYSKLEAWIDLLLEAQHYVEPRQVLLGMNVFTQNYGESLKSMSTWAKRWGWSRMKVQRYLKLVQNMGQIRYTNETVTTRITILNYEKYDPKKGGGDTVLLQKRDASEQASSRDRAQSNNGNNGKKDISDSKESLVDADAPTTGTVKPVTKVCPHQDIIMLYHDILPELNRIVVWDDTAEGYLRARWREDPARQMLCWWKAFFEYVKESAYLKGEVNDWQADLRWLVKPTNFAKVMNGNYHRNKRAFAGAMDFIEDFEDEE